MGREKGKDELSRLLINDSLLPDIFLVRYAQELSRNALLVYLWLNMTGDKKSFDENTVKTQLFWSNILFAVAAVSIALFAASFGKSSKDYGGKPSSPTYSMSAPRRRRASTNTPIGRFCMRSVPVSTCSAPARTDSRAVIKRMAVPPALILISYGLSRSALIITPVSSQSYRLSGTTPPPVSA